VLVRLPQNRESIVQSKASRMRRVFIKSDYLVPTWIFAFHLPLLGRTVSAHPIPTRAHRKPNHCHARHRKRKHQTCFL
jgi:hypothetical protein